MKKIVLSICLLCFGASAFAQDSTIVLSVKKGTINNLKPTATIAAIKEALPVFSGEGEEGSDMNCGGGVFYLNESFFFYTGANFINVRYGFTGTMDIAVIGKNTAQLKKQFKKPVRKYTDGSTTSYNFYKTIWGTLVVSIDDDLAQEFYMYAEKNANKIKLCL